MHRSEESKITFCADCGAEIAPESERGFGLGGGAALCFECAVRRGGRWDEARDCWAADPSLAGLEREFE